MAGEYFDKAKDITIKLLGNRHPLVVEAKNNIGKNVHLRQNDFKNALQNFQQALTLLVDGYKNLDIYTNPDIEDQKIGSKLLLLETLELKANAFMMMYGMRE